MNSAKAGAGLPKYERSFIAYVLVPLVKLFLGWNSSLYLLKREIKRIKKLINSVPREKLQQREEINRVFGIEEHSKDYSINMTLEHLTIVGNAMIFVIDTLSKEDAIDKEIKIEAVKPKNNAENEDITFFSFMEKYVEFIKNHPKNISKMTKKHPWFIEFNNKDWASFTYIHTVVHRRQIEEIIKKLNS